MIIHNYNEPEITNLKINKVDCDEPEIMNSNLNKVDSILIGCLQDRNNES